MSVPVTVTTWTGAALPIALLLALLVYFRWPAVRASFASTLVAFFVGLILYKAPLSVLALEATKGIWNSLPVIAVTLTAILIYEVSQEAGGFAAIQRDLTRLIPSKLLQVLALGWCFSSFLQGPSGFGVPVAVTAPLLIGIGVTPFWAVVIALIGHAWGNSFGTLALAWDALAQQTSLSTNAVLYWQAAWWCGILTGFLCVLGGVIICWQYGKTRGLRQGWPALLILGSIQAGGQLLLCQITPTLSAVIPTTIALGTVFLLAKLPRYATPDTSFSSPLFSPKNTTARAHTDLSLHEALLPYYLLVGISIVALLTPAAKSFLSAWTVSIPFPETVTGYGFTNAAHPAYGRIAWLTSSGFFLLLAAMFSGLYFWRKGLIRKGSIRRILLQTFRKSLPAAAAVTLLLIMSKIMGGSGQIDVLARGTASATGGYYALLAPMVGVLGAFMSSSNTSSNILFGQFQESMATLTHKNSAIILGAQTSGAAIGTMFSPSKVLLGTTTAGIVGQEGVIIKKLLGIALLTALGSGIIVFLWA